MSSGKARLALWLLPEKRGSRFAYLPEKRGSRFGYLPEKRGSRFGYLPEKRGSRFGYLPEKRGSRFSRKCATPSLKSSEPRLACISFSATSTDCASVFVWSS